MAATTKVWLNNNPPTCEDADLNGFKNESNNAIAGSGQALNTGDLQQTHKAMVTFAGVGNFYADSGAVNAYALSAVAPRQAAPALINGMIVRFVTANPSAGASTINYNGTGALAAVRPGGAALASGDIANEVTVQYDAANTRWIVLGLPEETGMAVVGYILHGPITAYTGESFTVTTQAPSPQAIAFSTDGTRMFIGDPTNDAVYEYTLSVPFDFAGGVAYSGNSFSIVTQSTGIQGLAFNTDGTRMFVADGVADAIFEYSLSVGFDLSSTVAYTGNSFSVATQSNDPRGLAFNTDGTLMYIGDAADNAIYEYSLSVGFDLSSTVAYTGNSHSTAGEGTGTGGPAFNADGTRMFVFVGSAAYEYRLDTGFDFSDTVTYTGRSFTPEQANANRFVFSTSGARVYWMDSNFSTGDVVYEYFSNFVRSIS